MMLSLAIKNILHRPMGFLFSWLLISVSVAIISVLLLLQQQVEKNLTGSIKDIDLVIGAKGSPLQLILSSVYHVEAPTGNIPYNEARKWMMHPMVETAIPLAYGDAYKKFPIIGTNKNYFDQYQASLQQGAFFQNDFEIVAGSTVAKTLGLKIGDQFYGTHGRDERGEEHKEHAYTIKGILAPTGTVADNLLIGNIETVWRMHEDHSHGPDAHDAHSHDAHDHDTHDAADTAHAHSAAAKEITAVLLKLRSPMALMQLPRMINQQSNLMAAAPAIEINRLFSLLGVGIDMFEQIGWGIMLLSAVSIFISLYNTLKEKKYELALMRTMGASRLKLLMLLLLEGLLLCIAGFITGLVISRVSLWALSKTMERDLRFSVDYTAFQWPQEAYLLLITLGVGIVASLLPSIKAYFLNISKTLADA